MTDKIIFDRVSKSFGEKHVLKDFCAEADIGSATCVMGPSGCGKTTLLRLLMGLDTVDGGSIRLPEECRFACVFQEDRLIPHLSCFENCRLVCRDAEKIAALLTALGLSESLHARASSLSGGMARRVAIARALLAESTVIVMDEPFKGLDGETRRRVLEQVKRGTEGKTLLVVTHDPADAEELGAKIIKMA